jgi:hypothetical protein
MELAHLVYQHWFITCLLLWAAVSSVAVVIRAVRGKDEATP